MARTYAQGTGSGTLAARVERGPRAAKGPTTKAPPCYRSHVTAGDRGAELGPARTPEFEWLATVGLCRRAWGGRRERW